jgi:hypothetical protein
MRIRARYLWPSVVLALGATLVLLLALPSSAANRDKGGKHPGKHGSSQSAASAHGAMHVRWDIFRLVGGAPPGPIVAGGTATATAPSGETITLTGSGTFVAPAGNNGGSGAVTGGGTWHTSTGASGTYDVEELVSFAFDSFQSSTPAFTDNIGALNERANGTAVLRISYSNGQAGVLTVGCHGPGAQTSIFEGVAVTKGAETFYTVSEPAGEQGRTLFHVRR